MLRNTLKRETGRPEEANADGFSFEIVPADVDECPLPDETPADHVLRLSRDKVLAVTCIGADCIPPALPGEGTPLSSGRARAR